LVKRTASCYYTPSGDGIPSSNRKLGLLIVNLRRPETKPPEPAVWQDTHPFPSSTADGIDRIIEQLMLMLDELETEAAVEPAAADPLTTDDDAEGAAARRKSPGRRPLPEHLPRPGDHPYPGLHLPRLRRREAQGRDGEAQRPRPRSLSALRARPHRHHPINRIAELLPWNSSPRSVNLAA
jgi:transposase IS166 family protein